MSSRQSDTYIDGLVQERRNSSALAMELCLSRTNLLTWAASTSPGIHFLALTHRYVFLN